MIENMFTDKLDFKEDLCEWDAIHTTMKEKMTKSQVKLY